MIYFIQNKTKISFSEKQFEKMYTKMLILVISELWNKGKFKIFYFCLSIFSTFSTMCMH